MCVDGDWKCKLAKALYEVTGFAAGFLHGGSEGGAAGLLCGPAAEVCSPAAALVGGVAEGTAAGAAAGKAVDSYYDGVNSMARAGKGRGGNQKPNADVHRIVKELNLNREGQRALHDEITGEDLSSDEIRDIARRLADQEKYRNSPPSTP